MNSNARRIFTVLFLVYLAQLAYYWPLLPERMASHFNAAGNPDGWQPKSDFFVFSGIVAAVLLGAFRILPKMFRHMPTGLINLPNKDYWLAPERREQTMTELEDGMVTFGNATVVLMIVAMHFALGANIGTSRSLPAGAMVGALIAYVAFSLVWMIRLFLRFRRPAGR